jgi:glutamate-ammonia-ligase adenylyltransferase
MRRRVEEHVPARAGRPRAQARPGRAARRRVRRAAAAAGARPGRRDPLRSTLDALAALGAGGYVGRDDAADLAASYRFLRLLEHRLQLQRLRRTHLLPAETTRPTSCAGWPARRGCARTARDAVGGAAGRVAQQHPPGPPAAREAVLPAAAGGGVADPERGLRLSEKSAARRLAALGWASPEGALAHLRALTGGVSRAAAIQRTLLPVLLETSPTRRPGPGPAGLPAGVRGARRHLVPAAAARRGCGRERLMRPARHVRAGARPAGAGPRGAAAARGHLGGPS